MLRHGQRVKKRIVILLCGILDEVESSSILGWYYGTRLHGGKRHRSCDLGRTSQLVTTSLSKESEVGLMGSRVKQASGDVNIE